MATSLGCKVDVIKQETAFDKLTNTLNVFISRTGASTMGMSLIRNTFPALFEFVVPNLYSWQRKSDFPELGMQSTVNFGRFYVFTDKELMPSLLNRDGHAPLTHRKAY